MKQPPQVGDTIHWKADVEKAKPLKIEQFGPKIILCDHTGAKFQVDEYQFVRYFATGKP